jgi:hypothetical protein
MNRLCRSFFGASALTTAALGLTPQGVAWAACDKGVRVDKTTVEETRQKLERAGYRNLRDWKKGCDNSWHATGMKGGKRVNVALLPDGHVVKEGD